MNDTDSLAHFGVKGMKWGVRKGEPKVHPQMKAKTETLTATTKDGSTLTLSGLPTPAIAKLLVKIKPSHAQFVNDGYFYDLKDPAGKKVGNMQVYKKKPDEMNVIWVDVNTSTRGKGYATAAMNATIEHARREGMARVTLEVPGISPDARHIYENLGFQVTKNPSAIDKLDMWGGLTEMELDLRHAGFSSLDFNAEQLLADIVRTYDELSDPTLKHYGVKGMRWGVIRKEDSSGRVPAAPKPTRAERKEARVQKRIARRAPKAAKLDELAGKYQAAIDAKTLKGPGFLETRGQHSKAIAEWGQLRDQAKKDAQAVREGKMTKNEKTLLIGAAAVGTAAVAYGTYKFVDSGEANRAIMKGKALLDGKKPEFARKSVLTKDWDPSQLKFIVADQINPDYGKMGTKNNCRRATFAYEMRRRGFDVRATRTAKGSGQTLIGNFNALNPDQKIVNGKTGMLIRGFSEEAKKKSGGATPFIDFMTKGTAWGENPISFQNSTSRHNDIFENLAKLPNGARGELGMQWAMGGGHSMAWEIVKGRPVIFDTQSGKMWERAEDFASTAARMGQAGFTRLDNVPLDEDFLMRWLKNA